MEDMLLQTDNFETAEAEIESIGGRVTMFLGDDLLVAKVPTSFISKRQSFNSASAHIAQSASTETMMFVQAYWTAREEMTKPPPEILHWYEKTAPIALPQESSFSNPASSPYRSTMTGHIAFVPVIVSGPGSLTINPIEGATVLVGIVSGTLFWTDSAPASANLKFSIDPHFVDITAADSSFCASFPSCHDVFANPALQQLGHGTGQAGRDSLAETTRDARGADGAYIAFFSKYRQSHFAYAYFGGGPIYMQYSNDGWGPAQIGRVFAHETGHVFNAPDEYTNCDCNRDYGRGTCTENNRNCETCTSRQTSCIMDSNDFSLCEYTKKHLGWCE